MDITVDNLVSGTIGAVLGSITGSLVMVWHNHRELRRAERLAVAVRVFDGLNRHGLNTLQPGSQVSERDLDALVILQPWPRRRTVRRLVQDYQRACNQTPLRGSFGEATMPSPGSIEQAIAALLPYTGHG